MTEHVKIGNLETLRCSPLTWLLRPFFMWLFTHLFCNSLELFFWNQRKLSLIHHCHGTLLMLNFLARRAYSAVFVKVQLQRQLEASGCPKKTTVVHEKKWNRWCLPGKFLVCQLRTYPPKKGLGSLCNLQKADVRKAPFQIPDSNIPLLQLCTGVRSCQHCRHSTC